MATRRLDLVAWRLDWTGRVTALGGVLLAGASVHRCPGRAEHEAGEGPVLIPPLRRLISTFPFAGGWGTDRRTGQHCTEHHEDREGEGEQSRPHTHTCRPTIQYLQSASGWVPGLLPARGTGDPQAGRLPRLGSRQVAVGVVSSLRHRAPLTGPAPPEPFHPGRSPFLADREIALWR